MDSRYGDKIVEVVPNRLYWISDERPPEGLANSFYFSVDKELKYQPFFMDYGPFNIAQIMKFVKELHRLLSYEKLSSVRIFHYTSASEATRLNAALVMGAFMVGLPGLGAQNVGGRGGAPVRGRPAQTDQLPRRLLRPLHLLLHADPLPARHRDRLQGEHFYPGGFQYPGVRVLRENTERRFELGRPAEASRLFDAQPIPGRAERGELTR